VLLLDEGGRLIHVVATDDSTLNLERLLAQTDDGPCLASVRHDLAVFCADLDRESHRWPDFTRRARAEGFRAVHAVPLSLRGEVVGGLNLFRRTSGLLTDSEQQVARLLATAAATGLLHRRAVHQRDTVNDQLRSALASRVVIEQAKGFLAARCDLSPELAFMRLRSYARAQRTRLTDVAQAVVDGEVVIP
jgi:GAF domain-containing protein